jgi:CheY-like chemotaxis protein
MGIPADMLPKVFDLFTQVDRTYDRAQGGLGIGLTLVRSLVDLHGGSVEAKSDGPGKGSEFVVRLPLAVGRLGLPDRGPRAGGPAAVAPRRILVVDDSRDAADSLGLLLKFLGAEVHTAHDGPAALEALETHRPSVVLLDIGLPGMDGFEVARQARQRPEGRDVTLIALTGWGQEEDRRQSREVGIDHHLVKPVDLGALQALLASLPPQPQGAGSVPAPEGEGRPVANE